jgi:hypothetical protein
MSTAEAHNPGNSLEGEDSDTAESNDRRLHQRSQIELEKVFRRKTQSRWRFTPVLAPLLKSRWIAGILLLTVLLQIGLTTVGLPGWQCPLKIALATPCPGCGLSTAVAGLLQGHWRQALQAHPFGPVFLAGILLLMLISLLPDNGRQKTVHIVDLLEQRTGFLIFIALGLFIHWGFRFYSSIEL